MKGLKREVEREEAISANVHMGCFDGVDGFGGYAMVIALSREMFEMELLPGVLTAEYGAGMSIGVSIVANDRAKEKEGRKSGIIWGGTPLNHLDPTKFGTLVFYPQPNNATVR